MEFIDDISIRWSDLDPNYHVRHSVYYDWGAQSRARYIMGQGLTPAIMQREHFGPILFREEALFKKELHFGDRLSIDCRASKLRRDYSRFSMQHRIRRGEELCAIINVDGAWLDTQSRKLIIPPPMGLDLIDQMPRTEDFQWE